MNEKKGILILNNANPTPVVLDRAEYLLFLNKFDSLLLIFSLII